MATTQGDRERFGAKLRERREAVGLTQSAVVTRLAAKPYEFVYKAQSISNWENGREAPPTRVVIALDNILESDGELAAALNVRTDSRSEIERRLDSLEAEVKSLSQLVQKVLRRRPGASR